MVNFPITSVVSLTLPSSPFKLGDVKVFLMPELVESSLGKIVDRNVFLEGVQLVCFHHFFFLMIQVVLQNCKNIQY